MTPPIRSGVPRRPISVITGQGDNFDGEGGTTVEIRAVNDGAWAYFRFVWNDPTRSLKQLPLRKVGGRMASAA